MLPLEKALHQFPQRCISDTDLVLLVGPHETPDSRYGKVKRLLAQGSLIHLRRGLYSIPSDQPLNPYAVAQYMMAPSYISLESALSYHQLIPEAVYTITSVTTQRSKEFQTPFGMFSYQHVQEQGHRFFMAKPWKALCDYVFCYRKEWKGLTPCVESLRLDREKLPPLSLHEKDSLEEYYRRARVTRFLKGCL
jgi:hypothetical protein